MTGSLQGDNYDVDENSFLDTPSSPLLEFVCDGWDFKISKARSPFKHSHECYPVA